MSTEQESSGAPGVPDPAGDAVLYDYQVQPEYGILGFTLRELIILGAWALAFLVSFFPVSPGARAVWGSGVDWILTIGVPTAAVFLIVLRRFSPDGIRRVGSLGIDQFASVAASVAAVAWGQLLWHQVAATVDTGALLIGWVPVVALLACLALVAATVAAPLIPRLRDDFEGRMETLAHRSANPVRPVVTRPRAAAPAPVDAGAATDRSATDSAGSDSAATDRAATDSAATDAKPAPSAQDGIGIPSVAPESAPRSFAIEPAPADDPDATRAIEVIPPPEAAPTGAGPDAADSDGAVSDAAVSDGAVSDAAATPGPGAAAADRREDAMLHTDPIGALHEIFESAPEPPATAVESEPDTPSTVVEAPLRRNRGDQAQPAVPGTGPFWILAPTERDVLDEHGHPLFRIGPHAWALVIEDRGGAYVVRHDDGRIGYLHDITDITKG